MDEKTSERKTVEELVAELVRATKEGEVVNTVNRREFEQLKSRLIKLDLPMLLGEKYLILREDSIQLFPYGSQEPWYLVTAKGIVLWKYACWKAPVAATAQELGKALKTALIERLRELTHPAGQLRQIRSSLPDPE